MTEVSQPVACRSPTLNEAFDATLTIDNPSHEAPDAPHVPSTSSPCRPHRTVHVRHHDRRRHDCRRRRVTVGCGPGRSQAVRARGSGTRRDHRQGNRQPVAQGHRREAAASQRKRVEDRHHRPRERLPRPLPAVGEAGRRHTYLPCPPPGTGRTKTSASKSFTLTGDKCTALRKPPTTEVWFTDPRSKAAVSTVTTNIGALICSAAKDSSSDVALFFLDATSKEIDAILRPLELMHRFRGVKVRFLLEKRDIPGGLGPSTRARISKIGSIALCNDGCRNAGRASCTRSSSASATRSGARAPIRWCSPRRRTGASDSCAPTGRARSCSPTTRRSHASSPSASTACGSARPLRPWDRGRVLTDRRR